MATIVIWADAISILKISVGACIVGIVCGSVYLMRKRARQRGEYSWLVYNIEILSRKKFIFPHNLTLKNKYQLLLNNLKAHGMAYDIFLKWVLLRHLSHHSVIDPDVEDIEKEIISLLLMRKIKLPSVRIARSMLLESRGKPNEWVYRQLHMALSAMKWQKETSASA